MIQWSILRSIFQLISTKALLVALPKTRKASFSHTSRSFKQSDSPLAAMRVLAISFRKSRAPGNTGLSAENVASLLCQDSKCMDARWFSGGTQQTRDSNVKALFLGHWFGTFSCPSSPQFILRIYYVVSFKVFLSFALLFTHLSPNFPFVKYEAFFSLHN